MGCKLAEQPLSSLRLFIYCACLRTFKAAQQALVNAPGYHVSLQTQTFILSWFNADSQTCTQSFWSN